jgi:hypothetical protein
MWIGDTPPPNCRSSLKPAAPPPAAGFFRFRALKTKIPRATPYAGNGTIKSGRQGKYSLTECGKYRGMTACPFWFGQIPTA